MLTPGHAEGEGTHGSGGDGGAGGAAETKHAVHLALGVQVERDFGDAACGRLDGSAAVARTLHIREARPRGGVNLLTSDVGREGRRLQHAGIDDQDRHARGQQQIAREGDLAALGVERADEEDRHGYSPGIVKKSATHANRC